MHPERGASVIDGARSVEGVRRRNLGEVLRLVHEGGPQSRARLTAATGLNRSTVADLVTTLADAGLVVEREPDQTRRVGRPSPVVAASHDVVAIAVNPEVDAIEMAAVGLNGQVRARVREEADRLTTPEEATAAVARILAGWRVRELAELRVVGIGIAVPGLVRATDAVVRYAPHLDWRDASIGALVQESTGLPVAVGNDASLGAMAEHLFGAAVGHDDVVYLNGGASGIGGGLIIGGRLVGGAGGYAGEWGQNRPAILDPTDRRTDSGVLEDEVSRARLLGVLGLSGADDVVLADALASATRVDVIEEVTRQRRILIPTLASAVNVLNPSAVVLGGFLSMILTHDADALIETVRAQAMSDPAEDVTILPAALGDDRLLIGAAEIAFAPLLADPLA
ncbi:ROK family transcriptional regulator [Microbacterium sp. SD291]|uniref:ROK family transcriptional regulator n=1 Tax=Microbacterium sp. SD291 TaxID=2782007 RepID=UPI001A9735E2|nr:ROK family transcriptional regulator [Microbacterium sp. SD291]MBO0980038.1 ROK family transcriptional regulator [Microbacterium sp. SD291]